MSNVTLAADIEAYSRWRSQLAENITLTTPGWGARTWTTPSAIAPVAPDRPVGGGQAECSLPCRVHARQVRAHQRDLSLRSQSTSSPPPPAAPACLRQSCSTTPTARRSSSCCPSRRARPTPRYQDTRLIPMNGRCSDDVNDPDSVTQAMHEVCQLKAMSPEKDHALRPERAGPSHASLTPTTTARSQHRSSSTRPSTAALSHGVLWARTRQASRIMGTSLSSS